MAVDPISTGTGAVGLGLIWAAKEGIKLFINKRNKNNKGNDYLKEVKDEIKELRTETNDLKVEVGKIQQAQIDQGNQLERIFNKLNGK